MVVYNPADLVAHAYTAADGTAKASLEVTAQRVIVVATNSEASAATEAASEGASEDEIPF